MGDFRFNADFKGLERSFLVAKLLDIFLYLADLVSFEFLNRVGAPLYLTFADSSPVALLGNRTPLEGPTAATAFPRRAGGRYLGGILLIVHNISSCIGSCQFTSSTIRIHCCIETSIG